MSAFKPGDKVRVQKGYERPGVPLGHVFTVADVEHEDHDDYITVVGGWTNGATGGMFEDRFEKVEPEFVVGQQVSGGDYERLPVGSVVQGGGYPKRTKIADDQWRTDDAGNWSPVLSSDAIGTRTLTHLGDGLADWERELLAEVDAEDKDDLYVEPEPLKIDQPVLVWALVERADGAEEVDLAVHRGAYRFNHSVPDVDINAIVRPDAGQVPPWAKPEATDPTLPTHADFARACKNFADALRPAAEAAERAVEQMMRAIREGGAS